MMDKAIQELQLLMIAHGATIKADGIFGYETGNAIRMLQDDANLQSTSTFTDEFKQWLIHTDPKPVSTGYKLDIISERNLIGVHRDLVTVVRRAAEIAPFQFRVIEGVRTLARQKQLLAKGASQTLRSRHIPSGSPAFGHAVDLAPLVGGTIRWDWPLYDRLGPCVKQAAHDVGVPVEWGGDWTTFRDGPHFQLPWKSYP